MAVTAKELKKHDEKLRREAIGFFSEELARLEMARALSGAFPPFAMLCLYLKESRESLRKRYPLLLKMTNGALQKNKR